MENIVTDDFPPLSTHEQQIDILLATLASIIDGRTAVYLSAPITSGKRFSEWHTKRNGDFNPSHPEHQAEHQREVIDPNRAHAQSIARQLRSQWAKVLIDPTAVADFPRWTQGDYRCLWARVIKQYVDTVIFVDNWQYSNGCAYEFLIAQQIGATTLRENRQPLLLPEGEQLIKMALADMRGQPFSSTFFLEQVVEELAKLGTRDRKELHGMRTP